VQESECGDRGRRRQVLGGWLGAGRVVGLGATLVVAVPPVVDRWYPGFESAVAVEEPTPSAAAA